MAMANLYESQSSMNKQQMSWKSNHADSMNSKTIYNPKESQQLPNNPIKFREATHSSVSRSVTNKLALET